MGIREISEEPVLLTFGEVTKIKDVSELVEYLMDITRDLSRGIDVDKNCILGMAKEKTKRW